MNWEFPSRWKNGKDDLPCLLPSSLILTSLTDEANVEKNYVTGVSKRNKTGQLCKGDQHGYGFQILLFTSPLSHTFLYF